jgi:exodeoxyribonuclease VII small subunit
MTDIRFEDALKELEQLVRRLEEGQVTLEEAVSVYERGITLKNLCDEQLKSARMRVDQITCAPDGTLGVTPDQMSSSR